MAAKANQATTNGSLDSSVNSRFGYDRNCFRDVAQWS